MSLSIYFIDDLDSMKLIGMIDTKVILSEDHNTYFVTYKFRYDVWLDGRDHLLQKQANLSGMGERVQASI